MEKQAKKQTLQDKNKVEKLENYLRLNFDFRYNEVLKCLEFRERGTQNDYEEMTDRQKNDIVLNIYKEGSTGFKSLLDALLGSASFPKSFNPFKSYFEELPAWNNTDYIQNLCNCVFVKDQSHEPEKHQWFSRMFKKHLVRTVACALRELDFNKHCLVLQGKQHDGKTSFIRFLAPKALKNYYKENPPLDHKDSVLALAQNILINLDELHSLNKTDANKVKSLFSQSNTKIREHYGTRDTLQSRYASFFATTNDSEFLDDVTGNVRWITIQVDEFVWSGASGYAQTIDIDLVWGQAYSLLKSGFKYQLSSDEIKTIEAENRQFQKNTPEMDLLQTYFTPADKDDYEAKFHTATDILMALQYATNNILKVNSVQLGKALIHLQFKRVSQRGETWNNARKGYLVKYKENEIFNFFNKSSYHLTTNS